MIIAIHQPEHMPWLGFFDKISRADTFVVLNNVQFRKNYFQNRNRIRTVNGPVWITVPVKRTLETPINEVILANDIDWKRRWWNSVYLAYKRSRCFDNYAERIKKILDAGTDHLADLNISLIKSLCEFLGIKTNIMLASELGVNGKGSGLLLAICKKLGATSYLSGISGKEYLKMAFTCSG